MKSAPRRVSIHATLAGGDPAFPDFLFSPGMFLSTPPSRVATARQPLEEPFRKVSIHATLAGGDTTFFRSCQQLFLFLSTPPSRVATFTISRSKTDLMMFLSTPPSRVATAKVYKNVQCLLRKKEKIICKIKNNLKHPPHIPIATSKKCTACPKTSDGIGAKLLGKVCLLPPRTGAATQTAHHPEQIRGGGQGAPRGFCSGCQAGKSAGCRFRGQSARPARL